MAGPGNGTTAPGGGGDSSGWLALLALLLVLLLVVLLGVLWGRRPPPAPARDVELQRLVQAPSAGRGKRDAAGALDAGSDDDEEEEEQELAPGPPPASLTPDEVTERVRAYLQGGGDPEAAAEDMLDAVLGSDS